jgi:riboflavin synthase
MVFTGIVEEVGRVAARSAAGLRVEAQIALQGARLGDSISINGVCLTVTELGQGYFAVDTVPETLRRTNLGELRAGDPVNLERPLAADGRLGGHFVQGHIEATAVVQSVEPDGEAIMVRFAAPPEVMRYIVNKGFIAVDGMSLTVVSRDAETFMVTLIPFTRTHTNVGHLVPGVQVNVETDILAKYVENLARPAG